MKKKEKMWEYQHLKQKLEKFGIWEKLTTPAVVGTIWSVSKELKKWIDKLDVKVNEGADQNNPTMSGTEGF